MNKISLKQMDDFLNNGYIILHSLFNTEEVNIILDKINSLKIEAQNLAANLPKNEVHKITHKGTQFVIQNIDELVKIHRIVWAGAAEPELLSISKQDKLLTPISQLLESNKANYIINSVHLKLPNDGIQFSLHQDIHHRRNYDHNWKNVNDDRSYLACVTAIDSITKENGPIMLIAGSQKKGEISREQLEDKFDLSKAIPLLMAPGDTVCMHQHLVHWSSPNESSSSRFTLINGFSYPGANHAQYPGDGSNELIDLTSHTEL